MKKNNDDIKYYQKSNDEKSTIYEIAYMGMLVGQIIVPNAKNKQMEFIAYPGINTAYARKILKILYAKFNRNILVKGLKKSFVFSGAKTKKAKKINSWVRYRDNVNQYIGKYREFKNKGTVGIELVLKKLIKTNDAVCAIQTLLKKYPVIKLTVAQTMSKPMDFIDSMSRDEIQTQIVYVLTWEQTKQNATQATLKPVNKEPIDDEPAVVANQHEFRHDIDPMMRAKALTLMMGVKQTVDDAKKKAQEKADDQYVCVKLLDKDGHFIENFYPKTPEQIRINRMRDLAQKALGE
ncbi:MAG: hypothetical protein IKP24_03765 [Alphaproteobacteria bacterium]|nr:hypothetical protein [Alphaproteobacteria bacterium]